MGGQTYTASNVRRFKGYKLYQTVSPDNMSGTLISAYPVGLRYVDATNSNGGIKRIKEVVGEDGTTRVEFGHYLSTICQRLNQLVLTLLTT